MEYADEIESLHDFFVDWYCGNCEQEEFTTVEQALADSFERIAPDATIDTREGVLESIREAYGTHDSDVFSIEIQHVEVIETVDSHALVRYEERQRSRSGSNGRLSTALFAPAKTNQDRSIEWRYLQETWLDPPE